VSADVVDGLASLGLSSIANVLAAVKTARHFDMGPDDVIVTVATDGAAMYASEWDRLIPEHFARGFDAVAAGEAFGRNILGATDDHLRELTYKERERIFNLGYFTWVEQQGVSVEDFRARKDPGFWTGLRDLVPEWDRLIEEFNARTGAGEAG
jgi:hypothetical protein